MRNLINTNNMITFTVAAIIAITAVVFNGFSSDAKGANNASDAVYPVVTGGVVKAFESPRSPIVAVTGATLLTQRATTLYRPTVSQTKSIDLKARHITGAWQLTSEEQTLAISDVVTVKDAITIDVSVVRSTSVGDAFEMTLPGDLQYAAKVESKTANGWKGHLEGFDDQYPVLFTATDSSVFATITTPEGSYTLESVNGAGWVYQNPTMAELSQDGFEDYLVPDLHAHHDA